MARHGWMDDTSPEALDFLIKLQRSRSPGERVNQMLHLTRFAWALAEGDVRRLHPAATEREVFLRLASRHLSRGEMIRAYGWDPVEHR